MSTKTEQLGLYKYDPVADAAKTFNISTALNDNWDKIDADSKSKDAALKGAIKFDAAQSLTDDQKTQARGNINAAPGGFGLGPTDWNEAPQSDADKIPGTGWFLAAKNVPSRGTWFIRQEDDGPSNNDALQTAWPQNLAAYYRGCLAQRYKISGTWGAWEWVNPPMKLGVEYRTTERYQGKPVYVQLIDFGYGPNNSNAHITKTIENIDTIVRWAGTASDGTAFPFANHMYSPAHVLDGIVYKGSNALHIDLYTNENKSKVNLYVSVFYTKSSD